MSTTSTSLIPITHLGYVPYYYFNFSIQNRFVYFFVVLALVVLTSAKGRAQEDEFSLFERAKNAYDRGEYAEAASRFKTVLDGDLKNPALVLECYKLLAVTYLFTGDKEAAERYFTELLNREPDYTIDPMLFPIEVIDFFLEVKANSDKRLEDLKLARAREEEKKRVDEVKRQEEELEKLKRNIYLERSRKQNSILVAMMPLGAGQFQNGQVGKGIFFLSAETLLAITAISTYLLHRTLAAAADKPIADEKARNQKEQQEKGYRIANQISFIAVSAVAVWGIADALFNYVPETVTWDRLEEKDVPNSLRPGKSASKELHISPYLGANILGIGFEGRF